MQVNEVSPGFEHIVNHLYQEGILGMDWLQFLNLTIDWFDQELIFHGYFIALVVSVNSSLNIELCSTYSLLHMLQLDKGASVGFALIKHSGNLSTILAGEGEPTITLYYSSDAKIKFYEAKLCDECSDIREPDFGIPC